MNKPQSEALLFMTQQSYPVPRPTASRPVTIEKPGGICAPLMLTYPSAAPTPLQNTLEDTYETVTSRPQTARPRHRRRSRLDARSLGPVATCLDHTLPFCIGDV